MKFHEFAQILHSLIGGKKYDFTIDFLKSGLDAEGVEYIKSLRSDEPGKSRIRKFLSGKNDITEIAPEIVISFNQGLFVDYILETIDESIYPEVCRLFGESPYNIQIDEDDVPEKLAEIYEQILQDAAKGKVNQCDSSNKKTPQYSISSRHKERMDDLINKLLNMIANVFYGYEGRENSISFQIQYGEYVSLNSQLSSFVEIYPFIDSLKQVQMYQLKPTDFQFTYESGIRRLEYSDFLNSIRAELLNYPSNNL